METEIENQEEDNISHKNSMKRQIFLFLFAVTFILLGTFLFILYGKGYRFGFNQGEPKVSNTGILQISSKPTGAQVYINDSLLTSTDNSVNLTPGKYKVKISKDGYNDWQKDIKIDKEVVSSAQALLLPKAPTLSSISTFGVESVIVDPSGTRLAFKIGSISLKRNGIYVFDMTARSFPVLAGQGSGTQLIDDTTDIFSKSQLTWSPDGKEILAVIDDRLGNKRYYLLKADGFNQTPQNITNTIELITNVWDTQKLDKETARIKSLKSSVQNFAKANFNILSWSPDETKILYQASVSAQMPIFRKPRLIGNNLLYERRDLEEDGIYVYDIKEDINTRILSSQDSNCPTTNDQCRVAISWFPDSEHLVYVHDKKIEIVEDDGANMTTIYAGPFIDTYVFPWPDGTKIVILTNLGNSNTSPTLYTISLK